MNKLTYFIQNYCGFTFVVLAIIIHFISVGEGCGDKPTDFRNLYFGLGAGLGCTVLYEFYSRISKLSLFAQLKVNYAIQLIIRYFLAYEMMVYGTAKIFDVQFTTPSLFTLDAKMIDLQGQALAWAFFSYSYTFQAVLGWFEVIGAVLILFNRTLTLGALLLFGLMFNVMLGNYYFDVCVKINSTIYTLMALYLLSLDFKRLWAFFGQNEMVEPRLQPVLFERGWQRQLSEVGQILFIIFTLGYSVWTTLPYHYEDLEEFASNSMYGVWEIEKAEGVTIDSLTLQPSSTLIFEVFGRGLAKASPKQSARFEYELKDKHLKINNLSAKNKKNIQLKICLQTKNKLILENTQTIPKMYIECKLQPRYTEIVHRRIGYK
jgi:uncharacterized membrane protein YphA (DoxX/SURF4 family)